MIGNLRDAADDTLLADIVVIGSGAAGLSLAAALIGSGLHVSVLEAGGEKRTTESQAIYRGELADPAMHAALDHFRVRALGGTSAIWGGRCIPFDDIDFEAREWVSGSGWPITRDTLLPFYHRAQDVLEVGRFDYDPASALPGSPVEMVPRLDDRWIETRLERFSRPTNVWKRHEAALRADGKVKIWLDAAVTNIRLAPNGESVDRLDVVDAGGKTRTVRGRHYVVCAGGLESTRLLLASNDVLPVGIGNSNGHLGRHYMAHLAATAGTIRFSGPPKNISFDYQRDADGIYCRRRLALTDAAQRTHRLRNTIFRTHLPDIADPSHGDAILSAMYLVKDLLLYEYSRKMHGRKPSAAERVAHVSNVVLHPLRVAAFSRKWISGRILSSRKLPSVVLGSATNTFQLEFHAEQEPNPESRVTLTGERDRFDMPQLKVDWRASAADFDSVSESYALLAAELERTGTGTLQFDPDAVKAQALKEGAYGGHHLGTARMAAQPADGVVDENCRVHGVANLHIAGGAVFPTSSQANPTLTIVALALRLADRLKFVTLQ